MTLDDAPPLTRRARRAAAPPPDDLEAFAALTGAAEPPADTLETEGPPAVTGQAGGTALAWVDPAALGPRRPVPSGSGDLLADRPRRSLLRPPVLVPAGGLLALGCIYTAAALLWPLTAVAPTVTAAEIVPVTAPASALTWPDTGSAAAGVAGITETAASTTDASSIASITKVVTVLMALEQLPLEPGEPGREFAFDYGDRVDYWNFRARGESALDVPVGGTLTQYQLLQGILLGSAGNYTERLAAELWPNEQVFANAARTWLDAHGLDGITVVEPTGILEANAADPATLLRLADLALAHPVVAEIVRTQTVELPGAGEVENTNDLLEDPSMLGVKTGGLWEWYNLLSAQEITVGETPVRLYAAVLGQPTDELRDSESARLLAQLAAEVSVPAELPAGTLAGTVSTAWGATADVITDAPGGVVLWNGGTAQVETEFTLDEADTAGQTVGSLTYRGPLDADVIELTLTDDIDPPSAWWRLTHPLELLGLTG
ncbi:D-alanyl-D-alanine carboxypeptidase [Microbacterium sp. MC2]